MALVLPEVLSQVVFVKETEGLPKMQTQATNECAMSHRCHIPFCGKPTDRRMLLCKGHWALVPTDIQVMVKTHFHPEQCTGKRRPTVAWLKAARYAINSITNKGVQWPDPIPGYDEEVQR